jgi:hypothetical protein
MYHYYRYFLSMNTVKPEIIRITCKLKIMSSLGITDKGKGRIFLLPIVTFLVFSEDRQKPSLCWLSVCWFWHLSDIAAIQDVKVGVVTPKMVLYMALHLICVIAICTGFGKPYSIGYVTLLGSILMICCGLEYQGMYEWMERFIWLTGSLVLIVEYLINGHLYGSEKKQD